MTRFLPLLLFLTLAAALAFALLGKPQRDIVNLSGSTMNEKLPVLHVANRDGKPQRIDTQGKVTLINFFASWCTPCVADHAEIRALASSFPALNLEGIAWNDTVSRVDEWLVQHRNPFGRVGFDTKGKAAIALGVRGMPESFLVDRHGMIRYHLPGPLTETVRSQTLEPLIQQLMEEK